MYRREDDDVPDIRKKRRIVPDWLKRTIATLLLATKLLGISSDLFAPAIDRSVEIHGHDDFTLPDGSTGVAYAGGIIRYTPDFNSLHREVTCTNGGLFHIAASDKMFVVYCDGGVILRARSGTFEVKPVPGNDRMLGVLVGTESLEITDLSGRSYGCFHAAEEAIINLETNNITRKRYDGVFISDVGIRPILRFERMTLTDAAPKLAYYFNVDVRVSGVIRKELIDATFPADISIFEALDAIKLANRDKYLVYNVRRNGKDEIQYVTISNK